jgi:hypothetical protein
MDRNGSDLPAHCHYGKAAADPLLLSGSSGRVIAADSLILKTNGKVPMPLSPCQTGSCLSGFEHISGLNDVWPLL